MPNSALKHSRTFTGDLHTSVPLLILAAVVLLSVVYLGQNRSCGAWVVEHVNSRRSEIYSSAFTFLSIVWGATVTVWGLLKSRATRYIERLHDNSIFRLFVSQLELRMLFALLLIGLTFGLYVVDLKGSVPFDWRTYIIASWFYFYFVACALIADSYASARVILD